MIGKLLIGLLPLVFLGAFVACGGEEQVDRKVDQVTPVAEAPDLQVSAVQLALDYEKDEAGAEINYRDKIVIVEGVILDIGRDILYDDPYITLGESTFRGVQCFFSEKEVPALATLSKGQTATVRGTVFGKITNVEMRGCALQ